MNKNQIENNTAGIIANGAGGAIKRIVRDSEVSNNTNNGITVSTTGPSTVLMVDDVAVEGNNFGLVAAGSTAGMLVGRSSVTGNATAIFTSSSGVVDSYGNNLVNNNGGGETFSGAVGMK